MENHGRRAGRLYFFNPRNYIRNLADYNSPDIQTVEVVARKYKTVPNAEPAVIFGFGFGVNGYNRILAQALKDAHEHFKFVPEVIAQESVCQHYVSLRTPIFSVDKSKLDNLYLTTRDVCQLAKKEYFAKNPQAKRKIAFVAHPAHMERVLATASQEGLEGIPFTPAKVLWNRPSRKNDSTASQSHWVSRELWLGRTLGSFL